MTLQEQSLELLGVVEQALSRHRPFGDSEYILGQLETCFMHRLDALSSHLPVAGELLDRFSRAGSDSTYPLTADTVVRCAILHAQGQVETGVPFGLPLADCERVLAATIGRLERGQSGSTLDDGSLTRLGPGPFHGWLWSEEHPSDIFGRSFRYLLKHRYGALPCTFGSDDAETLAQGARLLEDLLPSLAPSALCHARVITCVPNAGGWTGVASSSQFHLGGTIFLGRSLQSPWWVAEHLLHEAIHQKLYDFRHGHLLLDLDYERDTRSTRSTAVCSPWNPPRFDNANYWDVHRVFAAFHVYVHVALLSLVAERRAPELEDAYGSFRGMINSRKALERAHYLGEKLHGQCWDQLGIAGKKLVEWLTSVLAHIDPSPPPEGAVLHLCLDLYGKEAEKTAAVLKEAGSAAPVVERDLTPLADEEVRRTRELLAAIGAQEELRRFSAAVAQLATGQELGTRFPEVRHAVAAALQSASPDHYRLTESGSHDELVLGMTQDASIRLSAVLAGYPAAVAAAKLRASELRFGMSCNDTVGRLLAVLASMTPSDGRILEIGTGAGVGAAWIAAGLAERTDVQVVSVEIDSELSDATRKWHWPSYLEIVTADALTMLDTLPTFNLVFADAAPVKYGHLESVLGTLRQGGLLVVDDIYATMRTPEDQRQEKERLRRALLHHPELRAVELAESTGIILATKHAIPVGVRARP